MPFDTYACRSRELGKALIYMQAAFRLFELLTPSSGGGAVAEKRAEMKATMEHTQHSRSQHKTQHAAVADTQNK